MQRIHLGLILWLAGVSTASAVAWQAPAATGVAARENHADLPGVRLWYRDTGGTGVPVVFMHAATGSSGVWEYQIPAFTSAGYRFLAFDRRGFGRTVVDPAGPQPGTAADDLKALMDHLGISRFHLVGTAAGAFASFDYALSFPDRLRSLVIANSIGGVLDEDFQELDAGFGPRHSSTRYLRKSESWDRHTEPPIPRAPGAGPSWNTRIGRRGRHPPPRR
jgi:pimeloyl-ACP methyl ester carboxylesterase